MYIVGIDIGKNHHEASIVSPEGKQIGRSLRFATTHKGADSLMSFIFKNIGNSPCVFGMEATGHYWYPIYSFLKAKGYTICVINPIQSDSLRKMYIRQTKNDSIDSFLIAEVIRFRISLGLLPWLMKTSLPCVSYVVIVILSFLPELKLSSESVQLWNKSSQSMKNSFLLFG